MRYTNEVCRLFDCDILCDIEVSTGENPEELRVMPLVAIGSRGEYQGGLVSFIMTPFFSTMERLDDFCKRHIERFREVAEDQNSPAPDATEWEKTL